MNSDQTTNAVMIGDAFEAGVTHIRCINRRGIAGASCDGVATLSLARTGVGSVSPAQVQPGAPRVRTMATHFRVDCPKCGGKVHGNFSNGRPVLVEPCEPDQRPAGPAAYRPIPALV